MSDWVPGDPLINPWVANYGYSGWNAMFEVKDDLALEVGDNGFFVAGEPTEIGICCEVNPDHWENTVRYKLSNTPYFEKTYSTRFDPEFAATRAHP